MHIIYQLEMVCFFFLITGRRLLARGLLRAHQPPPHIMCVDPAAASDPVPDWNQQQVKAYYI
jgi:hypothetical protein